VDNGFVVHLFAILASAIVGGWGFTTLDGYLDYFPPAFKTIFGRILFFAYFCM
jgi:nitrate reductase NapE component